MRITEHSATLLDHIYIHKTNKSYNSGILISDVSDHFATFTICYDKHILHKANPEDKIVQTINDIKFKTFLANEDFSTIMSDTNSSYDKFIDIYKQGFDTIFPL